MMRERLLTTRDADEWRSALPADACVMGSVEYALLGEAATGASARLFVLECDGGTIAYPFFIRSHSSLPFDAGPAAEVWDIFTPEYTGPLELTRNAPLAGFRFAGRFARLCQELGIVAEFAHLNPWKVPAGAVDPAGVEFNRPIVYVDLTGSEAQIWAKSLTKDGRSQTKQSQKAGVTVRWADSESDFLEFNRLYTETMQRREALDQYYFPPEHFLQVRESMPGNSRLALSEYEGRIVAGGLFFTDRTDVYYHWSALDMEFASVRPVNAYLHEAIRWAASEGKERLLLGGGYAPNDGVIRFKENFSPLHVWFRAYKRVHDEAAYADLNRRWSVHHGGCQPKGDFFPAYRTSSPVGKAQPSFSA